MKLTEESLNLVIDILNDLICEGKMLNDVERRSQAQCSYGNYSGKKNVLSYLYHPEKSKVRRRRRKERSILVSQMLVWHGMRQTRVYCEMFWRMYRTMKLVNTFSGWQRN